VSYLTLKTDVASLMGLLFGKDSEKMFLDYYDDKNPLELLSACKNMMTKLLGPDAAHKHCVALRKQHPEIDKIKGFKIDL
jgi:hypothetical protein